MCHHHLGSRFFKWSPQELHSGYTSLPSYQAWKSVLFSWYPCLCQQFILLTLAFLTKKKITVIFICIFLMAMDIKELKCFSEFLFFFWEVHLLPCPNIWLSFLHLVFLCLFCSCFFSYLDISGAILFSQLYSQWRSFHIL